jgi:alpha-tubulin suppressor-like RCC1 family protein
MALPKIVRQHRLIAAGEVHCVAIRDGTSVMVPNNRAEGVPTVRVDLEVPGNYPPGGHPGTGPQRVSRGTDFGRPGGIVWSGEARNRTIENRWQPAGIVTRGGNYDGQLGDGTQTGSDGTVVVGLETRTIVAVACGGNHTLALDSEGKLWAWGRNTEQALGDGTTVNNRTSPVQVAVPAGNGKVVEISSGRDHCFLITDQDKAFAWGRNHNAQLGDFPRSLPTPPGGTPSGPSHNYTLEPVRVNLAGMNSAIHAAGGLHHSVAINRDGAVFAWGANDAAQNGAAPTVVGTDQWSVDTSDIILPKRVVFPGETAKKPFKAIAVAAGGYVSMAIDKDFQVWIWGGHDLLLWNGQNPDQFRPKRALAARLPLPRFNQIACGSQLALARDTTGRVWRVNYDPKAAVARLVKVDGLPDKIVQIAVGTSRTALALDDEGQVWGWGENDFAQLQALQRAGGGVINRMIVSPVPVVGFVPVGTG